MTEITVSVSLTTLKDLVYMAQKSPQYYEGSAWSIIAISEARRSINAAFIRAAAASIRAAKADRKELGE